jgi:hypothetical protein
MVHCSPGSCLCWDLMPCWVVLRQGEPSIIGMRIGGADEQHVIADLAAVTGMDVGRQQ